MRGHVTPACIHHPALGAQPPRTEAELLRAEELFRVYDLFVWLALRFGSGAFKGVAHARQARRAVSKAIEQGLRQLDQPAGGGGGEQRRRWRRK